jgi:hypothetical protein
MLLVLQAGDMLVLFPPALPFFRPRRLIISEISKPRYLFSIMYNFDHVCSFEGD